MVADSVVLAYCNVMAIESVAAAPARLPWRKRFMGGRRPAVLSGVHPSRLPPQQLPPLPLAPLVAEYTATFGSTWSPVTRRKHRDDFARLIGWLEANDLPATTAGLEFSVLVRFVESLRARPKVTGVWRGSPDALARSLAAGSVATLSANSINAYLRPIRGLSIWLVDEGLLAANPFRRSRRRASLNPLLPSEVTPAKSATLDDLRALERGCAGDGPLDLRDQAIVSLLITTACRNSSVRLLRLGDIDFERSTVLFRRAKGARTLQLRLHPDTRTVLLAYLKDGRPALVPRVSAGTSYGEYSDDSIVFLSHAAHAGPRPLTANAISLMLTRRYHAGGGSLRSFGSHRIRHATATLLINNGMGLEEVSRYLGHSSTMPTRRYAQQTPDALGLQAADALARAGVSGR